MTNQTNNRIREEWRENLKPKTKLINWDNEETRQMVQDILDLHWEKLEPQIAELLKSQKEREIELDKLSSCYAKIIEAVYDGEKIEVADKRIRKEYGI